MGINKITYNKKDFYEDLNPLISLKEPHYSYKQYLGQSERGEESPLKNIKLNIEEYYSYPSPRLRKKNNKANTFFCLFISWLFK